MMTVVALVKFIPNPPALVEIKKTWYATTKLLARESGEPEIAYVISPVGTGGTITTYSTTKMDTTHQSNVEVSPRSIR